MAILIKIPMPYFTVGKAILKIYRELKNSQIIKEILRKKNTARGNIPPDFKLYYKALIIKTVWHCIKSRHIGQ